VTQIMERPTQTPLPPRDEEMSLVEPGLGFLGVLSAISGLVLWFVETINIFAWDIETATVDEGWRYAFLIAAGALFAGAFGLFTRRVYRSDRFISKRVALGGIALAAALAVIVVFAIMWIV